MILTDYEYQYSVSSTVSKLDNATNLNLAQSSELLSDSALNCFFYGRMVDAFAVSKCLSVLAKTVQSHFAIARGLHLQLRDPIISVGNNQIKFEGFSSCNSVYARVDIQSEAIDGEFIMSGCTNVDFNNNTVRALNALKKNEQLILAVGANDLTIATEKNRTQEKKVSLPNKWIKGLGNVQVYLSKMEFFHKLTKVEAVILFKSLPKSVVKDDFYLIKTTSSFSFSTIERIDSVKIGGIHRLSLVTNLLPHLDAISVYFDPEEQGVAFVVHLNNVEMLFLFSAGSYRGFSGEGKALENLIVDLSEGYIEKVNQLFKANQEFNATLLAIEHDIDLLYMESLKASLASIGLLGFDLSAQHHFYRRLPFKMERLNTLNPRFNNALKLIDEQKVKIQSQENEKIIAEVMGKGDVKHKVILEGGACFCTCTWYTNHETDRGFCKHILATKLKLQMT